MTALSVNADGTGSRRGSAQPCIKMPTTSVDAIRANRTNFKIPPLQAMERFYCLSCE